MTDKIIKGKLESYLSKSNNLLLNGFYSFYLRGLSQISDHTDYLKDDSNDKKKINSPETSKYFYDIFSFLSSSIPIDTLSPIYLDLKFHIDNINLKQQHIALRPSNNIISDLINTRSPSVDIQQIIGERLFYIDLPEPFIKIDDIKIKSVFINKFHFCAYPNVNENGEFDFFSYNFSQKAIHSNFDIRIIDDVFIYLYDLVKLLLLYYESDQSNKSESEVINFTSTMKISEKKQRAKIKKSSIFKFIYLERPNVTTEWRDRSEAIAYKLTKKITIRGHWRWQPFGPKKSKRKLIWIKEHYKGQGEIDSRMKLEHI